MSAAFYFFLAYKECHGKFALHSIEYVYFRFSCKTEAVYGKDFMMTEDYLPRRV